MKIRYRKKNVPEFFEDLDVGDVFSIQESIYIKINLEWEVYNSFNVKKNAVEIIDDDQKIKPLKAELVYEEI